MRKGRLSINNQKSRINNQKSLSTAVLILLLIFVAFDAELNQAVDQVGISQSRSRPQLGVHADGGETRHGIDLVQENLPRFRVHQKIYTRQAGTIHSLERGNRELLNSFCFRLGQFRGDDQLRTFVDILRGVVVELLAGNNLSWY